MQLFVKTAVNCDGLYSRPTDISFLKPIPIFSTFFTDIWIVSDIQLATDNDI